MVSNTMKLLVGTHPAFRQFAPKYNNSTRVAGTVPNCAKDDANKRRVIKYAYAPSW